MTGEPRTIPTVDPAFIAEVKQLTEESMEALRLVVGLTQRAGRIMEQMDRLQHETIDDVALNHLRDLVGYDELMDTWFHLAGHATAAADHPTDLPQPGWYDQLLQCKRERYATEVL